MASNTPISFLSSFVLEERNRLFCHVAKLSSVEYAKIDFVNNHYWIVAEIREMISVHFKGKRGRISHFTLCEKICRVFSVSNVSAKKNIILNNPTCIVAPLLPLVILL